MGSDLAFEYCASYPGPNESAEKQFKDVVQLFIWFASHRNSPTGLWRQPACCGGSPKFKE